MARDAEAVERVAEMAKVERGKAGHERVACWRQIQTYSDRTRAAMRGFWANPESGLIELEHVVAVRPSIEGLPLSCTGTASPEFRPSPLRAAADPEDLLPKVMMTRVEAELMIKHYLHSESDRLGPLYSTIDAQAAATRGRLLDIVFAAAVAGSRTDMNITVAVATPRLASASTTFSTRRLPTRPSASRAWWAFTRLHTPATTGLWGWNSTVPSACARC